MPTGSPLMPRTHLHSHWLSCGHTRPQIAGRLLVDLRIACAPAMSPSLIFWIKDGICTPTGQPETQGMFLQFRQRSASPLAIS